MSEQLVGIFIILVGLIGPGFGFIRGNIVIKGISIPAGIILIYIGAAIAGWLPWPTINLGI